METNQARIYPGMTNPDVEFFKNEKDLKLISNGKILPFAFAPFAVLEILKEEIENDIEVQSFLRKWHPGSPTKQIEQFAWCRFGGLDFSPDIKNNKLQDGEYHPCQYRNTCPASGIICKMPKYKNRRLSLKMIDLMVLLCSNSTNEVIAEKLEISYGSFHLLKKKLYELLEVQTKQEVALIARDLSLV